MTAAKSFAKQGRAKAAPFVKHVRGVAKRYIVTSSQNNTGPFKAGWDNLLALAAHYGAEVIVASGENEQARQSGMDWGSLFNTALGAYAAYKGGGGGGASKSLPPIQGGAPWAVSPYAAAVQPRRPGVF